MILADKIIDLRKKAGWSQEELAEKLAVTRQSVSKWEGAQSIPDMDKVVQMSRLFGVTTDYLLKDEIETAEPTVTEDDRRPPLRRVTIGEASDYLALREFKFLEEEPFETEYGVTGMVKERQKAFKPTYDRMNTIGTVLCVLSFVPLFAAMALMHEDFFMTMAVCLLLAVVGVGVYFFVYGGTIYSSMEKLLEEGDYTRREKSQKNITGPVSVIYWLVATAIFMIYTFGPKGNGQPRYSWIIWAVAGVLYAAVLAGIKLIRNRK